MLTVQNRINGFLIITDIGAFLNRVNCTTGPGVYQPLCTATAKQQGSVHST